jgi:hypothetical protein
VAEWQDDEPSVENGGRHEPDFVDYLRSGPERSREEETRLTARARLLLVLLPLGFAFFLTSLFLAMRGIMDLGGMVAVGGPYEIAHPAPSYVWIFPVAIIACILIVFFSMGMFSWGKGRASLVALFFWPAIFLSLGWNFLEYGFFKTGGTAWGWIVCGILFAVMGGLPLYLVIKRRRGPFGTETEPLNKSALWPQLVGIAAGIPLGILFFSAIS